MVLVGRKFLVEVKSIFHLVYFHSHAAILDSSFVTAWQDNGKDFNKSIFVFFFVLSQYCVDSLFLLVQFAFGRNLFFLFPFIVSFLMSVFVKVLRDGRWND